MLHVDVLTAYLICGVSALAGAAMLRLARPDEARLRSALGWYAAALVTFGLGLVPAGLGPVVGQPAFQLMMTFGTLCGPASGPARAPAARCRTACRRSS